MERKFLSIQLTGRALIIYLVKVDTVEPDI